MATWTDGRDHDRAGHRGGPTSRHRSSSSATATSRPDDQPSESRNPISDDEMVAAFIDAVDAANADPEIRVVILTGADPPSPPGDVRKMRDGGDLRRSPAPDPPRLPLRHQQIPLALQRLDVPLIAAVNGPAVGAELRLPQRWRTCGSPLKAWFAESFVKLGIIPGDGGAWFLPRLVGPARAAEMTLTGDRVDAQTALEWGLVSRVVAPEDLLSEARALAERVAVNPPHAVAMAKKLLRESGPPACRRCWSCRRDAAAGPPRRTTRRRSRRSSTSGSPPRGVSGSSRVVTRCRGRAGGNRQKRVTRGPCAGR